MRKKTALGAAVCVVLALACCALMTCQTQDRDGGESAIPVEDAGIPGDEIDRSGSLEGEIYLEGDDAREATVELFGKSSDWLKWLLLHDADEETVAALAEEYGDEEIERVRDEQFDYNELLAEHAA